jgi:peptidoglycan/LPS O-acetylase OafA/YrhL
MTAREGDATTSDGKIVFADLLRGVAVAAVLVSHFYVLFWKRPELVAQLAGFRPVPELQAKASIWLTCLDWSPVFNWGEFGVALFFLVSGFVIPIAIARYDAGSFLLSRVVRLVPTYMAGFAVTVVTLLAVSLVSGKPILYPASTLLLHAVPGLRDLFGLPLIDGVVWTLEVEVKFYIVCAILSALLQRRSLLVFAVMPAFLALLCLARLGIWSDRYHAIYQASYLLQIAEASAVWMSYMFIGKVFSYRHLGALKDISFGALLIVLTVLFVLATRILAEGQMMVIVPSYLLALGTFLLAWSVRNRIPTALLKGAPSMLAQLSYSIYVVHAILGYALMRAWIGAGLPWILAPVFATGCTIYLAVILNRYVEEPTKLLARRLANRSRSAQLAARLS